MRLFQWLNPTVGKYDVFAVLSDAEAGVLLARFGEKAKTSQVSGKHYYFLNTGRKTITPLPFLALAFGGQYNDDPPIGAELPALRIDLAEYRLRPSKWARE